VNQARPMPPRPKGAKIEQTVEIDAPASVVWEVLSDVGGWGRWNPVYPEASGSIGVGDTIEIMIALEGMKPQKSSTKVFHSLPGQVLQFGTPAFAGLAHATRYIEIEPLSDSSCRVVNGEIFGRLLGPLLVRLIGAKLDAGMKGQNAGLKTASEAKWRERAADAL